MVTPGRRVGRRERESSVAWKTIPGFSNYEISSQARVRNKKSGHICSDFLKYGKPHVTIKCDWDGTGRNVSIFFVMAEVWSKARGWNRWKPVEGFRGPVRDKARELLEEGKTTQEVSLLLGIPQGEVILFKNRM
jgi:hypothetical protein